LIAGPQDAPYRPGHQSGRPSRPLGSLIAAAGKAVERRNGWPQMEGQLAAGDRGRGGGRAGRPAPFREGHIPRRTVDRLARPGGIVVDTL